MRTKVPKLGFIMAVPPGHDRYTAVGRRTPSRVYDAMENTFHSAPKGRPQWSPRDARIHAACWNAGFAVGGWESVGYDERRRKRKWRKVATRPPHVNADVDVPIAWSVTRGGAITPVPPLDRIQDYSSFRFAVLGRIAPAMIRDNWSGAVYCPPNDENPWDVRFARRIADIWNRDQGFMGYANLWYPVPGTIEGCGAL